MEGNPADLTVAPYTDGNVTHDHTFYGNGCPQTWAEGGSKTPCSTRIIKTVDNENQKNGTYFNFQAATSGTGGALSTSNTVVPDTFCPLGWQMPYSGTGGDYYDKSKSWRYIFNTYHFTASSMDSNNAYGSYAHSQVLHGYFSFSSGLLVGQGTDSSFWSSTNSSSTNGERYHRYNSNGITYGINVSETANKTLGYALRCVTRYLQPEMFFMASA